MKEVSGKANDDATDPRAKRREYERLYRERNRERIREKDARWRAANPDKVTAKQAKYQQTEKGRATWQRYISTEKRQAWARNYRSQATENNRRWYYSDLDRSRMIRRTNQGTRRQREAEAAGWATPEQLFQRAAFWGFRCWVCSGEWLGIMDHVIPLALGGANWPTNRRPICGPCNAKKGSKHPLRG